MCLPGLVRTSEWHTVSSVVDLLGIRITVCDEHLSCLYQNNFTMSTCFHDVLCTLQTDSVFLWYFILHTPELHCIASSLLPSCAFATSVMYCHPFLGPKLLWSKVFGWKPELHLPQNCNTWMWHYKNSRHSQHVLKQVNSPTWRCMWKLSVVSSEACHQLGET